MMTAVVITKSCSCKNNDAMQEDVSTMKKNLDVTRDKEREFCGGDDKKEAKVLDLNLFLKKNLGTWNKRRQR